MAGLHDRGQLRASQLGRLRAPALHACAHHGAVPSPQVSYEPHSSGDYELYMWTDVHVSPEEKKKLEAAVKHVGEGKHFACAVIAPLIATDGH
jgi:hypothetical protein